MLSMQLRLHHAIRLLITQIYASDEVYNISASAKKFTNVSVTILFMSEITVWNLALSHATTLTNLLTYTLSVALCVLQ